MFVIAITVAIGYGFKQVNKTADIAKKENFTYQSTLLVEDVLSILNTSKDIQKVVDANSSIELYALLSQAAFIPFEVSGLEIVLKISSARSKFNPSSLDQNNSTAFRNFLNNNGVNSQYLDILADNLGGIKEDNSYNSAIFDQNPYLFRDYIASEQHLKEINDFYAQEYNDNSLAKIDFKNLFYFSSDKNSSANYKIDLNYAKPEVWELLTGATKERAEQLSLNAGAYEKLDDVNLNDEEKVNLAHFKTSFFEPILFVEIDITQNGYSSEITFEYNIKEKKGSNFVYKI